MQGIKTVKSDNIVERKKNQTAIEIKIQWMNFDSRVDKAEKNISETDDRRGENYLDYKHWTQKRLRCTEKKYRNIEGKEENLTHTGSVIRGESKWGRGNICREKNKNFLDLTKRQIHRLVSSNKSQANKYK